MFPFYKGCVGNEVHFNCYYSALDDLRCQYIQRKYVKCPSNFPFNVGLVTDPILKRLATYLCTAFNRRQINMSWSGTIDCLWAFCDWYFVYYVVIICRNCSKQRISMSWTGYNRLFVSVFWRIFCPNIIIYRNCSEAINYCLIIKHARYLKICLISLYCVRTLNKRKKMLVFSIMWQWLHLFFFRNFIGR